MATANHNLSNYKKEEIPIIKNLKLGIVQSKWNQQITDNLTKGAKDTFFDLGYDESQIQLWEVPGSFELIFAANQICKTQANLDALIVIGSVIRGETAHFDYVCSGVTQGIKQVNLDYNIPVIFCVLTDDNLQQSIDRSGGKHGNKGVEAAITALQMIHFNQSLK